ncbi:MAG: hypothetical protein IKK44_01630 [Clostridium sp.]|nr:hypothetical protein [Clostridium sp.]
MAEFEDKLNSILGDQAAMSQIMALAQSLSGGERTPPAEKQSREPPSMERMGDPLSLLGDLDPRIIRIGTQLLREYQSGEDQNTALLLALKPFLRQERYARLDKAIQLARLSRVIRVALGSMGKIGEAEDV